MKSINQYIQEKLVLTKKQNYYTFFPKTRDELKELIDKLIKERGNEADLNDIDTSKINDMSELFFHSKFNGNISEWNVSKVTNMRSMFNDSQFNGDISCWDVSKVEHMVYMFYNSEFNGDISKWKINKYCDKFGMFFDCPIKENHKPKFSK
jgi:surface protein